MTLEFEAFSKFWSAKYTFAADFLTGIFHQMHNLTQLYHFKLVAQEGSFGRAAEIAHITQPALSNSIRSLEKKLGFLLFERSERPIQLSSEAKAIMSRVDTVLFEARNLDKVLENLVAGQSGHVRLGMSAVFATSLGGTIIAEWHEAFPNVKLDLVVQETTTLLTDLRDEHLDLIVGDARDFETDTDDLDLIELPAQAGGAFCRAGHPILDLPSPNPTDLALYRFAGTHFPTEVTRAFARLIGRDPLGHEPIVSVDSHNIAALRDAVAQSDLILLTTSGTVRNALALGILKQVPLELGIDGVWSVGTSRGRVLHPAVPQLIEKILEIGKRDYERNLAPYAGQYVHKL